MPFLTQINGATIDLGAETPVVTLPPTGVLNSFGESREIEKYNVLNDGSATTTQPGEYVAPVVGREPIPGSYQGGVEFSNVGLDLGPILDISATVNVNDISGDYFVDGNGNVFIITENPLNADNITANVSNTSPGLVGPITTELVDASLTDIVANPLIGTLLPGGVNGLLNSVVTTQTPDPDASLVIADDEIGALVCFAAGTQILTPFGYRSVEDLLLGDLVCTKDNGDAPISWIGSRNVASVVLTAFPNFRPIRISAGALGAGLPLTDLMVSPQHRILIRSKIAQKMFGTDEVLVAAKQLLQIEGIDIAQDVESVDYYHFMFDRHEVVIANGAETESMFTGPQALKSVSQAARAEIFALFPQLADKDYAPQGARTLASGRMGRKLVSRHIQHRKVLV